MMATAIQTASAVPSSPAGGANTMTKNAAMGTTLARIQLRRRPSEPRVRSDR